MVWATVYVARSCTVQGLDDAGQGRAVQGLFEALFAGVFPPEVYRSFSCASQ